MAVRPKPQARRIERRSRDRERRHQDFLLAAEKVFARDGYHAAAMEEIAREAGYATGTIYRYFASKHELYQTLLEIRARAHQAHLLASTEGEGTCRERILALLRSEQEFIRLNHDFLRLLLAEVASIARPAGQTLSEGCRRMLDDHQRHYRRLVDEGQRRGEFHTPDPELAWILLASLVRVFFQWSVAPGPTGTHMERRRARLDSFLGDAVSRILPD